MVKEGYSSEERVPISSDSQKKKAAFEISMQNYKNAAEKLGPIIEEISLLKVPEETKTDWRILLASMRTVDYKLDQITDPVVRAEFTGKIVNSLEGGQVDFSYDKDLEKAMMDVRNLYLKLSEDHKRFFISSLLRILKVTEKIKIENDSKNFIRLTRIEGQISTRIFLLLLPEEFILSGNYRKLVHSITRLGRAANSFDSFVDLSADYNNKQTQIKPNVLNRLLFIGAILSDSVSMLKDIGFSKVLIKQLLLSAKHVIQGK